MLKELTVATFILATAVTFAEEAKTPVTPKQIYSEDIQIVDDTEKVLAHINVYGKMTLSEGVEAEQVVNLLINRMAKQSQANAIVQKQLIGVLEDSKAKAQRTAMLAAEIIKTYAPPAPKGPDGNEVKNDPKKEEPKKKRLFPWWGKK